VTIEQTIRQRLDQKTKPPLSLGRLEGLAASLGRIQGTAAPRIQNPTMVIFAGDHGVAEEKVSAFPQSVTGEMVKNFLSGGAAISVMARTLGWSLLVVDAGVVSDLPEHPTLWQRKMGRGTKNFLKGSAMSMEEMREGLQIGEDIAANLDRAGCTLLGLGEMGIGNSSAASALLGLLLTDPVEQLVGRGTGLDQTGFLRKLSVVRQACALHSGCSADGPLAALAAVGGFEMVMLAGAARGAARRQIPVVVDGFIVTAALLAMVLHDPEIRPALLFAHRSQEPGHEHALRALFAEPYLDLGLRLGEGSGAALLLPLAKVAVALLEDMATFESAGVARDEKLAHSLKEAGIDP
jgi:nicotinate-nucleotide--dimethylbenzimidazole phosphoribosyltransferase